MLGYCNAVKQPARFAKRFPLHIALQQRPQNSSTAEKMALTNSLHGSKLPASCNRYISSVHALPKQLTAYTVGGRPLRLISSAPTQQQQRGAHTILRRQAAAGDFNTYEVCRCCVSPFWNNPGRLAAPLAPAACIVWWPDHQCGLRAFCWWFVAAAPCRVPPAQRGSSWPSRACLTRCLQPTSRYVRARDTSQPAGRHNHPLSHSGTQRPLQHAHAHAQAALLDSMYGTERGLAARSEIRAEINELITQLEAKNPTPSPTDVSAAQQQWQVAGVNRVRLTAGC